jgi:3,4-dihydroxy 2-butanone 4-phosphate synthase
MKDLNIVVPMVGQGSRFVEAGHSVPKPLVEVKGKPMIAHAIESLQIEGNYIFIVKDNKDQYTKKLTECLKEISPECTIVKTSEETDGQACSVLLAKDIINSDTPLLVVNCDQYLSWDSSEFLEFLSTTSYDGVVTTYDHPGIVLDQPSPYSFVALDDTGLATNLEEKFAISNNALNGLFYWSKGSLFVSSAEQTVKESSSKRNGEFYISTTYNNLIADGCKIGAYKMSRGSFYSLGSPEDIEKFNLNRRYQVVDKLNQIKKDIMAGKPVVVVDDYDRENEADIILSAEKVTEYNMVFAMRHAKGLMCLPCTGDYLDNLEIPMQASNDLDKLATPFSTSIDAAEGITTGMSVFDRLKTIEIFRNKNSSPGDLAYPGHLFPLRAKKGLLKDRRGHTEASVELMKYSNLSPVAVIIECMNDDGTMMRGETIDKFCKIYGLNVISVAEIYDGIYN